MTAVRKEGVLRKRPERVIKRKENIRVVNSSKEKILVSSDKRYLTRFQVFWSIVSISLISFLVINLIIRYTLIGQLNNDLSVMNRELEDLKAQKDYISMELQPHLSVENIERKASLLGMIYPDKDHIYILENDGNMDELVDNSSNNMAE